VWLTVAARSLPGAWRGNAFALSYALIPLAGAGLIVGLSGLPAALAHGEGLRLAWLPLARASLLVLGAGWSGWLAYRQIGRQFPVARHAFALAAMAIAVVGVLAAWTPFVFRWL
jgi:hypothetical protein